MIKKEVILEKSRQSHQDEGMQYAESQGHRAGYIALSILYIVLSVLSLFFWQIETLHALSALFFVFFCAEWYAKHHFTKKIKHLIAAICANIAAVFFTINFIMIIVEMAA